MKIRMFALFVIPLMVGIVWASSALTCEIPPCPCGNCGCPPCEEGCRVTAGGVDTFSDLWNGVMAYGQFKKGNGGINHYTFGGQAGAPTAEQPQPWGEWTHHQESGPYGSFLFHAGTASAPENTEIDFVQCADPGGCKPSGDPPSPVKRIYFRGVGTFKNIRNSPLNVVVGDLYSFDVLMNDLGEPGKSGKVEPPSGQCPPAGYPVPMVGTAPANCDCPDFYRIRIFGNVIYSGPPIYEVYGYIKGGNVQIHYPIP